MDKVIARLEELKNLVHGWDGYDGVPVRPDVAEEALWLAKICTEYLMAREPQIVPGSDGSVQLEWHYLGSDIEIEVLDPANLKVWIQDEVYPEGIEFTTKRDLTKIGLAFERLYMRLNNDRAK